MSCNESTNHYFATSVVVCPQLHLVRDREQSVITLFCFLFNFKSILTLNYILMLRHNSQHDFDISIVIVLIFLQSGRLWCLHWDDRVFVTRLQPYKDLISVTIFFLKSRSALLHSSMSCVHEDVFLFSQEWNLSTNFAAKFISVRTDCTKTNYVQSP